MSIQPTLLIIDDEPDILEILAGMLSEYRVLTALDVAQAREIFDREPCSLVITDIRMPGASGRSLITYVQERTPQVPIIVITGCGAQPDSADRHVSRWIIKPFRRAEVVAAVRELLSGSPESGSRPAPGVVTALEKLPRQKQPAP